MKKITEGIICFQEADIEYQVAKIEYSYQDDEEEEYAFHPYYNVIDFLPVSLFQGIPGLDLDLRKSIKGSPPHCSFPKEHPARIASTLWNCWKSIT